MLPSKTLVVALTATATHYVKDCIVHALQMAPLKSITRSVNRPNNRYSVERVSQDGHTAFKGLLSQLQNSKQACPR